MAETVGVHEHLIAASLAAALQVALVGAGDEGLHAADFFQQPGASGHIQLRHHVVQQQDGRLAGLAAEYFQLCQLHAQRGSADLPLGSKHLHLPALKGEQDVLPVDAEGGRAAENVLLAAGLQRLDGKGRDVLIFRHAALVFHVEILRLAAADVGILFSGNEGGMGDHPAAQGDHHRALGSHRFLEGVHHCRIQTRALFCLAEQCVSLVEGLLVLLQSREIGGG